MYRLLTVSQEVRAMPANTAPEDELRKALEKLETTVAVIEQWTTDDGNEARIVKNEKLSAAMIDQIMSLIATACQGASLETLHNLLKMHLRGKEGETLHWFADDHYSHRRKTEVLDDYVKEPPSDYIDVYGMYHKELDLSNPPGREDE
jgi:hypothetical protein